MAFFIPHNLNEYCHTNFVIKNSQTGGITMSKNYSDENKNNMSSATEQSKNAAKNKSSNSTKNANNANTQSENAYSDISDTNSESSNN